MAEDVSRAGVAGEEQRQSLELYWRRLLERCTILHWLVRNIDKHRLYCQILLDSLLATFSSISALFYTTEGTLAGALKSQVHPNHTHFCDPPQAWNTFRNNKAFKSNVVIIRYLDSFFLGVEFVQINNWCECFFACC
jgi:hypothetical protein